MRHSFIPLFPLIADFSSLCAVQFSSVHSLTLGPFQFSHLLLLLLCTIGHNQLGSFFCTPNEMARLLLCLLLFPSLSVAFSVKLSELVNVMHANVSPDDDDDDGEGKTRGKTRQVSQHQQLPIRRRQKKAFPSIIDAAFEQSLPVSFQSILSFFFLYTSILSFCCHFVLSLFFPWSCVVTFSGLALFCFFCFCVFLFHRHLASSKTLNYLFSALLACF